MASSTTSEKKWETDSAATMVIEASLRPHPSFVRVFNDLGNLTAVASRFPTGTFWHTPRRSAHHANSEGGVQARLCPFEDLRKTAGSLRRGLTPRSRGLPSGPFTGTHLL